MTKINEDSRQFVPQYGYIPQEALDALGRRFAMGALKHGEYSYKAGDAEFYTDRLHHAMKHIQDYLAGDTTDTDHLAGAITDVAIAIYGHANEKIT